MEKDKRHYGYSLWYSQAQKDTSENNSEQIVIFVLTVTPLLVVDYDRGRELFKRVFIIISRVIRWTDLFSIENMIVIVTNW
jgi:hypothetical protein